MRADLLALTDDDLTTLSNRGTVKRATRELDEKEITWTLAGQDTPETLSILWSDGFESIIPEGKTLKESSCTCAAPPVCRHLVRAVLVYREISRVTKIDNPSPVSPSAHSAGAESSLLEPAGSAVSLVWNPGDITDGTLEKLVNPKTLKAAVKLFQQDHVIELHRSEKPYARFHNLPVVVRFLVPGDLRYTYCTCGDEPPCLHVPVAIWSFRLQKDQNDRIISTHGHDFRSSKTLELVESCIQDLVRSGVALADDRIKTRLRALAKQCTDEQLIWQSELLEELLLEMDRYHARDALFSAESVVDIVGELLARNDATRAPVKRLPRLFLCGDITAIASGTPKLSLVGLGCDVVQRRSVTKLTGYFYEPKSGQLIGIEQESSSRDLTDFGTLASQPLHTGLTLDKLSRSNVLSRAGKVNARRILKPGREKLETAEQDFGWSERLREPVLADSFSELKETLLSRPPEYLGPRQIGQRFHVCKLSKIEGLRFVASEQKVQALLFDRHNDKAFLSHPYTTMGAAGVESLLRHAGRSNIEALYIAGHFRISAKGLEVEPVSIVILKDGKPLMLRPWIDGSNDVSAATEDFINNPALSKSIDPSSEIVAAMERSLAELLVTGSRQAAGRAESDWLQLKARAEKIGAATLARSAGDLLGGLEIQAADMPGDEAAAAACKLSVVLRVAQELAD